MRHCALSPPSHCPYRDSAGGPHGSAVLPRSLGEREEYGGDGPSLPDQVTFCPLGSEPTVLGHSLQKSINTAPSPLLRTSIQDRGPETVVTSSFLPFFPGTAEAKIKYSNGEDPPPSSVNQELNCCAHQLIQTSLSVRGGRGPAPFPAVDQLQLNLGSSFHTHDLNLSAVLGTS